MPGRWRPVWSANPPSLGHPPAPASRPTTDTTVTYWRPPRRERRCAHRPRSGRGYSLALHRECVRRLGTQAANYDAFVTAGPDGLQLPPGVPVGRAVQVRGAANPLEQEVFISPYADLDRLTQVGASFFTPSGGKAREENG